MAPNLVCEKESMERESGWSVTGKACDSCKAVAAAIFCRADSTLLCLRCDSRVHTVLASRHARVWLCEVCERAPASVTCKADAAALCATCDRDIHSANPLSRRHDRFPVVPFYDSPPLHTKDGTDDDSALSKYLSDSEEAASWLLPSPKDELKPSEYLLSDDVDPYLDLDLMMGDQKPPHQQQPQYTPSVVAVTAADGVVPVVPGKITKDNKNSMVMRESLVDGVPCYYDSMDHNGSKPLLIYDFNSQSISQSSQVSSSSMEVGVVPDHNTTTDLSTTSLPQGTSSHDTVPLSGIDREARVMRYREKRKNRKFEKTIRYASRKAYAETRPRIKGRFAKRTEGVDLDGIFNSPPAMVVDARFSVVPSF